MAFMHDNAPEHRANATRGWLAANNIPVFGPWPARSPDMNPIDNLWAQLETAILLKEDQIDQQTKHTMESSSGGMGKYQHVYVRRLIFSMRRRCTALVQAAGGHTKY